MSKPVDPPILVIGIPRSGTTWLAEVLSAPATIDYVHEPDNETYHPLAVGYKQSHRFPTEAEFAAGNIDTIFRRAARGWAHDPIARVFPRLIRMRRWDLEPEIGRRCGTSAASNPPTWYGDPKELDDRQLRLLRRLGRRAMFGSAKWPDQNRRLIKSVHAVRCIEPVADLIDADVCVVLRNPFAVVASLVREVTVEWWPHPFKNADRYRGVGEPLEPDATEVELVAEQTCSLLAEIRAQLDRNPKWVVASHDDACRDSSHVLKVASELGLTDHEEMTRLLSASVGVGNAYSTQRIAIEQIDSWTSTLTSDEVMAVEAAVDRHGLGDFLDAHAITGER